MIPFCVAAAALCAQNRILLVWCSTFTPQLLNRYFLLVLISLLAHKIDLAADFSAGFISLRLLGCVMLPVAQPNTGWWWPSEQTSCIPFGVRQTPLLNVLHWWCGRLLIAHTHTHKTRLYRVTRLLPAASAACGSAAAAAAAGWFVCYLCCVRGEFKKNKIMATTIQQTNGWIFAHHHCNCLCRRRNNKLIIRTAEKGTANTNCYGAHRKQCACVCS